MAERKTLFFTGATGYVGGSVLSRILSHPVFPSLHITALIRDPSKAASFNSLGIHTVIGCYADHDLLTCQAQKADIVFTCVDSDNAPAAKAILDGLKKRHEATGIIPIHVHTSGMSVLFDNADEMHANNVYHSDMDSDSLNSLPSTRFHREVDSLNISADEEGYIRSYLVFPGCILGTASGTIPDLGLSSKFNVYLNTLINPCIKRRQGGMVGMGHNIWPVVDIDDLADLYMILFIGTLTDPSKIAHGRDGYYFCVGEDTPILDHAKAISKALVILGAGESEDARSFDETELNSMNAYFRKVLGADILARADRSRSIGWRPRDINDLSQRYIEEVKLRLKANQMT